MKKVLVVSWSQTGQLASVVDSVLGPVASHPSISVVRELLEPEEPYPFPWPFLRFFDTFPETVHARPRPLKPLRVDPSEPFDLVILAYQVWFLSPSQPMTAYLLTAEAATLLRGKPVITLIACRNMWLMAQETMKDRLRELGARLIDNVVLTDRAPSAATFVSTPLWMLTGRRGPFLGGRIPAAGIDPGDIEAARRFGEAIAAGLPDYDPEACRPLLAGLGAVAINERLIASERIGRRSFRLWGRLLMALGPPGTAARRAVLCVYILFLATMILTVVPVTAVLKPLVAPWTRDRTSRQRAYFAAPSGEAYDLRTRTAHG
jgi:hypothetical protein